MGTKKVINTSVIGLSVLSAIFFLVLFSSVRCEFDDMVAALPFRNLSLIEILHNRYYQESLRPIYPLLTFFSLRYSSNTDLYPYSIFAMLLCVWGLFLFSIYKLLSELFSANKGGLLLCVSQLFFTALYFLTTARVEVFGFISVSEIHLVPVIFVFLSAWLLIKKQVKRTDHIFLIVSALFVAGGADHIGPITLAALAVIGITFLIDKNRKTLFSNHKVAIKKTIFFSVTLFVFFLLFASNPGLWQHYHDAQTYTLQNPGEYHTNFFATIKMLCAPGKLLGLIFLAITWTLFFNLFQVKTKTQPALKYFFFATLAVIFLSALTGKFAYNSFMVKHVWFVADAAVFVLLSACFVKYFQHKKAGNTALLAGSFSLIIIIMVFNIRHVPRLIKFSSDYDKMVEDLRKSPPNQTITIQNFPDPDLTSQAYFSEDPNNDMNILFCEFYHIPAKVSVKK